MQSVLKFYTLHVYFVFIFISKLFTCGCLMCASSGSRMCAEAENALVKQKSETFDQEAGSCLCRAWQVRTLKVVAWNIQQKGHPNICRQKARLRFVGHEICRWDKVTKLTVSLKSEGKAVTSPQGDQDLRRGGLADSKIAQRWLCVCAFVHVKALDEKSVEIS